MKRETGTDHAFCGEGGGWQAGRHTRSRATYSAHDDSGGTLSVTKESRRNAFTCSAPRPTPMAFPNSSETSANVLVSASMFARNPARRKSSASPTNSSTATRLVVGSGRDDVEQRAQLVDVGRVRHVEHDGVESVRCLSCPSLGGMF